MNAILSAGKWMYAIPMLVFGIFHFMGAKDMAAMAPFGGEIMVYITGAALVAAAVSIFIGKMDKLAAVLLGVFLLLTAFLVHAPGLSDASNQMAMPSLLKDFALAGGAFMYAKHVAKDNAVIG